MDNSVCKPATPSSGTMEPSVPKASLPFSLQA